MRLFCRACRMPDVEVQCTDGSIPSTGDGTLSIGSTPASSSCISSMFTRFCTEGRPVSMTKCATLWYSGSRAWNRARNRASGILDLQQRPLRVVPQSAKQLFGRRPQVNHRRVSVQRVAVGIAQHHATAGGQHAAVGAHQLGDHFLFDVPKALLALGFEELADGAADLSLDHGVTVAERHAQSTSQMPPDGRLAAAGHADQADEHARPDLGSSEPGINAPPCAR